MPAGPCRTEIELNHNAHDVFLSPDPKDTAMAIGLTKTWLETNDMYV